MSKYYNGHERGPYNVWWYYCNIYDSVVWAAFAQLLGNNSFSTFQTLPIYSFGLNSMKGKLLPFSLTEKIFFDWCAHSNAKNWISCSSYSQLKVSRLLSIHIHGKTFTLIQRWRSIKKSIFCNTAREVCTLRTEKHLKSGRFRMGLKVSGNHNIPIHLRMREWWFSHALFYTDFSVR